MKPKISREHSQKIEALISQKVFTLQDIISLLDNIYTASQIKYHIDKYYSQYKNNLVKEYSKGGTKLEYLLKQIFPSNKIEKEFSLGEKLRVDFVILEPYNLAFEYDGSQHDSYVPFFHNDKQGFAESQERDLRKEFLLKNRGLNLIRINNLEMTIDSLKCLIDKIGYGNGVILDKTLLTYQEKNREQLKILLEKSKVKIEHFKKQLPQTKKNVDNDDYKNMMKEKQKAFRKEQYQKQKAWLKEQKKLQKQI